MKIATICITKTMLDKAIIDANKSVRELMEAVGYPYGAMASGDRHALPACWEDGSETIINLYRTANARADRRISIKGIKAHVEIGNLLLIEIDNSNLITLRVTKCIL
jgi:SH3-like domain-containing protein